jgi:hypothetical protein
MSEQIFITYGSNLDTMTTYKLCPCAEIIGVAEIKDHRLNFRGDESIAFATIEPCTGDSVPGIVWQFQDSDVQALDQYVEYPMLFGKKKLTVSMFPNTETMYAGKKNGVTVNVTAYVMNDGFTINLPPADYLNTILDGYDESGFDPTAIEAALERAQNKVLLKGGAPWENDTLTNK